MVKVTKQQADIIGKVLERYKGDKTKATLNYVPSKTLSLETFMRCMIEGWELEQTKEEQLLDFYNNFRGKQGPTRYAIRMALSILGLYVEGISNDNGDQD